MNETRRFRPTLGVLKTRIPEVLDRAQAQHDGMAADVVTYGNPNPPLPAFLSMIQNVRSAETLVKTRVLGAAAKRDAFRDVLYVAMGTECSYVGTLADASPGNAVALIQNAGLVVIAIGMQHKPLLALKLGPPSGVVLATANVGLLLVNAPST